MLGLYSLEARSTCWDSASFASWRFFLFSLSRFAALRLVPLVCRAGAMAWRGRGARSSGAASGTLSWTGGARLWRGAQPGARSCRLRSWRAASFPRWAGRPAGSGAGSAHHAMVALLADRGLGGPMAHAAQAGLAMELAADAV